MFNYNIDGLPMDPNWSGEINKPWMIAKFEAALLDFPEVVAMLQEHDTRLLLFLEDDNSMKSTQVPGVEEGAGMAFVPGIGPMLAFNMAMLDVDGTKPADTAGMIVHELEHQAQYLRGDLVADENGFQWKGESVSLNSPAEYWAAEHEQEAYLAQAKFLQQHIPKGVSVDEIMDVFKRMVVGE